MGYGGSYLIFDGTKKEVKLVSVNYCVADESNYPRKSHPALNQERKKHPLFYSPTLEAVLDSEEFGRYKFTEEEAAEVRDKVLGRYDGPIMEDSAHPDDPHLEGEQQVVVEAAHQECKYDGGSGTDSDDPNELTQGVIHQGEELGDAMNASPSDAWGLRAKCGSPHYDSAKCGDQHYDGTITGADENSLSDQEIDYGPLQDYDSDSLHSLTLPDGLDEENGDSLTGTETLVQHLKDPHLGHPTTNEGNFQDSVTQSNDIESHHKRGD